MSAAIVLAAHGTRDDSNANEIIRGFARELAAFNIASHVCVAFHANLPHFSAILDELPDDVDEVVVVPVMTSRGYYADEVLPRELRNNRTYDARRVTITAPVGTHEALPGVIAERLIELSHTNGLTLWSPATLVAIVGHGTPRHAQSRKATCDCVAALARRLENVNVCAAFIDEPPFVAALPQQALEALIVVPFLIGGTHAAEDIPVALGLGKPDDGLPVYGVLQGRPVYCDRPLGDDPRLLELIVDLASAALRQGARGVR
jgi:sirohydrochlorin cobaltochelatase